MAEEEKGLCKSLPSLVSSFVDTFIDYVVSGQFLPKDYSSPSSPSPSPSEAQGMVTWVPPVERLVAVGDIHGDLGKAKEALRIAGVTDEHGRWVGGTTTVVQVGDVLDRGGEEIRTLYFLERLGREARRAGGDLLVINGNHEIMNMAGNFRYATAQGLEEFQNWAHWYTRGIHLKERCTGLLEKPVDIYENMPPNIPKSYRSRWAALRPGGPISTRFLAPHPTIVIVGGTVFVHGGLLPAHVRYGLPQINNEVRDWMLGTNDLSPVPPFLLGQDAVVWLRKYSEVNESKCRCDLLEEALEAIPGAKRMVVGHTIQQPLGINAACGNRVVRVDVGMSEGCGNAAPEVLEIRNDRDMRIIVGGFGRNIKVDDGGVTPGLGELLDSNASRHLPKQVEVRA